jgi:hypothetical protein
MPFIHVFNALAVIPSRQRRADPCPDQMTVCIFTQYDFVGVVCFDFSEKRFGKTWA